MDAFLFQGFNFKQFFDLLVAFGPIRLWRRGSRGDAVGRRVLWGRDHPIATPPFSPELLTVQAILLLSPPSALSSPPPQVVGLDGLLIFWAKGVGEQAPRSD